MWRRRVRAEKQARDQPTVLQAAGEVRAADIESAKASEIPVGRKVAVTAENATPALIEIGDHDDVCLVIASAGFEPRFPFIHLIGGSKVCVPVGATDLQATEFVDQEEVDHTSHRICSVHSRSAVLQDIDVIDH